MMSVCVSALTFRTPNCASTEREFVSDASQNELRFCVKMQFCKVENLFNVFHVRALYYKKHVFGGMNCLRSRPAGPDRKQFTPPVHSQQHILIQL
jgi:hypothetical protein